MKIHHIGIDTNDVDSLLKVYKLNVDFWLSLGTPKELHLAEYWFDYFSNRE